MSVGIPYVYGQDSAPPLGDNFIFFVNGTNTLVPDYNGKVITDPTDATNQVVQYQYGDWSFQAFRFPADVGRDLSKNREDGDVLHARLWVDPENAGKPNVQILLEDKTDGSGANDGSADIPFRLVWRIPESMRNGEWHEISVPLPPATYKELKDAKEANQLTGLDSLWLYAGGWSSGGFGVGVADELGPNTTDNPNLWKEFEWTNVQNVGIHFDNNQGGGNIYLDDLYIGAPDLDLSIASDPPSQAMGVSAMATADSNTVSWSSISDAGGYKVYYSLSEIKDVEQPGVNLVNEIADGNVTSVGHSLEIPHISLAPVGIHYAVTTISGFGVENKDVAMSTAQVENENFPVQPYIAELTADQETHLEDLLFDDSFEDVADGFPEGYMPFELNTNHFKAADAGLPDGDDDLSARLWAGYGAEPPLLYLYVEVTDDQISLQATGGNPGLGWQHDSIEFGWGNYDVRDVDGGGIFTGSPHQDMLRGEAADYSFRLMGQGDGTKEGTDAVAFTGWSIEAVPQGSESIYDQRLDGSQVIGYKILSVIPLDQIQSVDSNDAQIEYPTGDKIGYFPFNFVLNDGDGAQRDAQIQWSIKGNADGQWWNTPAQWPTVALVGKDAGTSETPAGLQLAASVDGTAIESLDLDEGATQTYYLKLLSQPTADVTITITGQDGTSLVLDNDGDASTNFAGLTFTPDNWDTAQMVMVTSVVDGNGDDETIMLTHSTASDDSNYNEIMQVITVNVSDVTQTSTEDGVEIPDEVTLYHNYPNPFNPSTVITFALPASETVSLRIFDYAGRTVATLLDQQLQSAGIHSVQFDASGLASGVYLYTLESESSVLLTRRMLLVK